MYSLNELQNLYNQSLLQLIFKAMEVHAKFHEIGKIQKCHLISIKTGGCSEDCAYCAQSSRYQTSVPAQVMMPYENVMEKARKAIAQGATRICLGAAWKKTRNSLQFEEVLRMVKGISSLGVEVCCTLGMLNDAHVQRLKEAGLHAYNHNLDTSKEFYPTIISSHTYQDRLDTLDRVEKAGVNVCSGGILGMGETPLDRLKLLLNLSNRDPQPESVPINRLSPIPGTPLENQPPFIFWDMLRIIAIARIIMPNTMLRLSAGRIEMSHEQQTLCFLAGANSIFVGEQLLTVPNSSIDQDKNMFQLLGLI